MIKTIELIIVYIFALYLYNWGVSFIHEVGHYLAGKKLNVQANISFTISNHCLPIGKVKYKMTRKFTPKEDIFVSAAGVIFSELFILINMLMCNKSIPLLMTLMILMPKYLFCMIPVQGNDGFYIVKALDLKEKAQMKLKRIIFGLVVCFTICIFVVCAYLGYQYLDLKKVLHNTVIITGIIYYITYIRYLIKLYMYLDDRRIQGGESKVYCKQ